MPDQRVLVVGTTPDYIAYINRQYPSKVLFITDPAQRNGSSEPAPDAASEIVCHLAETGSVLAALKSHLSHYGQTVSGVACYDCEWLSLASRLADDLELPFPSTESVQLSRNKYLSKTRWSQLGVRCPRTQLMQHAWQAVAFLENVGAPIVLKPLSGSGSELTFKCDDAYDAVNAMHLIADGLRQRSSSPMYRPEPDVDATLDPRSIVQAEEFVEGREYSCDFVIDGSDIDIIRVAKKLRGRGFPFGITLAYLVPARLPGMLDEKILGERLRRAAQALGLHRAICMVDFMISRDEIVLLELTPRIGGDCLPPLLRASCGMDTIGLALDFAEGKKLRIPPKPEWREMIGLRIFSRYGGTLKAIDLRALSADSRVKEIFIKRSPGHQITLPPEDYDSWLLGHIIFRPEKERSFTELCEELMAKVVIDLEPGYDQKLTGFYSKGRRTAEQADSAA